MTFDKVVVVNGGNPKHMGRLFESTDKNHPDLVILMGEFWFPEEVSWLENQASEAGIHFDLFLEKLGNDVKHGLVNRATVSAMAWIEIVSHLNSIGCYVFVLGRDFPIFYKDGEVKRSIDFGRLMFRFLNKKLFDRKWRYFDKIDVIEIADLSMVFWRKDTLYRDNLLGYRTELRTILVTDGEPTSDQIERVNPWRIISPFTAEHCSLK